MRIVDSVSNAAAEGAHAWVILFDERTCEFREMRDAVSDDRGEMLVPKPFGSHVGMLVRKRGYVADFRWLKRGDLPETVDLTAGMPLRGSVTLADGRPGAGARVFGWDAETGEEIAREAPSIDALFADWIEADADGRFEIDGIAPGRAFILAVRLPGYGVYRAVHEAQPELVVRLDEGAILEGRVFDEGGALLSGADVYVETEPQGDHYTFDLVYSDRISARAVTDAEGRFRIAGIAAGRYVVTASHDYWARGESEPVDLQGDDLQWRDVAVEKCASLEVWLADPPDGSRWLHWDLSHLDGSPCWSRFWSNSWTEGEAYSRDGIHAGTYRLTVTLDERPLVERVIDLRPGETLELSIPAGR